MAQPRQNNPVQAIVNHNSPYRIILDQAAGVRERRRLIADEKLFSHFRCNIIEEHLSQQAGLFMPELLRSSY
jgi:hypothetical protein